MPRIYILGFIFLIILAVVGSCGRAGKWLVKNDQTEHADVMVLLVGSLSDRVLQTADLYHEKVASRVWIVRAGTGPDSLMVDRGVQIVSSSMLAHNALTDLGVPAESIVLLPGGANSTSMEAEIVRDYLRTQEDVNSLLLVSSSEHTRRACMIFKAAVRPIQKSRQKPVSISCCPSKYTDFHAEKWWKEGDDIQEVVMEYLKMLNFVPNFGSFFELKRF